MSIKEFKEAFAEVEDDFRIDPEEVKENIGPVLSEIREEATKGIKKTKSHAVSGAKHFNKGIDEQLSKAGHTFSNYFQELEDWKNRKGFKKGFAKVEDDLRIGPKKVKLTIGPGFGAISKKAAKEGRKTKSRSKQLNKNMGPVLGEITIEAEKGINEPKSRAEHVVENIGCGSGLGEMTKIAAEGMDKAKSHFFKFFNMI